MCISQQVSMKRCIDPTWKLKRLLRFSYERDFDEKTKCLNETIYKMIDVFLSSKDGRRRTIVDSFIAKLEKSGEEVTRSRIRDMVWDMMIAGSDTTACAMTWIVYEVTRRPDILKKIRDEIDTVDLSEFTTYSRAALPYLWAVISESIRLNPSVPMDGRGCNKPVTLPNGVKIEPGWQCLFNPYTAGRNTRVWGNSADEFAPERWLDRRDEKRREAFEGEYPAFNGGTRSCLGKQVAYLEIMMILSKLFKHFDLRICSETIDYTINIMLWVKGGLRIQARPRRKETRARRL